MKIPWLVFLIILSEVDSCVGDVDYNEQRVLLRKLRKVQLNTGNVETKRPWNLVLADALVNTIRVFKDRNKSELREEQIKPGPEFLIDCFSKTLLLYKWFVYDKYFSNVDNRGYNPKDEVELLHPRYPQKICSNCENIENTEVCPRGFVKDESGKCVNTSKYIMYVPPQCPLGYKRDRLGYCREMF